MSVCNDAAPRKVASLAPHDQLSTSTDQWSQAEEPLFCDVGGFYPREMAAWVSETAPADSGIGY